MRLSLLLWWICLHPIHIFHDEPCNLLSNAVCRVLFADIHLHAYEFIHHISNGLAVGYHGKGIVQEILHVFLFI